LKQRARDPRTGLGAVGGRDDRIVLQDREARIERFTLSMPCSFAEAALAIAWRPRPRGRERSPEGAVDLGTPRERYASRLRAIP